MALIFNESRCASCGQPLGNDRKIVAFTAFLPKWHRLWRFSDGVLHRKCYELLPERGELERLYSRFQEIWDSRPKELTSIAEMEEWGRHAFKDFPGDDSDDTQ